VISLMFCFLAILGWGLGCFLINLRAYRDISGHAKVKQPLALSILFLGIGSALSAVMFLVVWPQRPFVWIKPRSIFWSLCTGFLYGFGAIMYIVAANKGIPAIIEAPIGGLDVIVPTLWYMLYDRECIDTKTALGYFLSILSLFLFSGILSPASSFRISMGEWSTLLWMMLSAGTGTICQGEASKDVTLQQFPQLNTWMNVMFCLLCAICACVVSLNDVTNRCYWVSFSVDQILTTLSSICDNLGTGFFTLCFVYAEDFNLMIALSSFYIIIPGALGIVVLDEAPTWNVLLGLFLALAGIIVLSYEAKDVIHSPIEKIPLSKNSFRLEEQGVFKPNRYISVKKLLP